jgi:hypothetical protein
MAAVFVALSNQRTKSISAANSLEIKSALPPEKDWEFNVELGMLMLNG